MGKMEYHCRICGKRTDNRVCWDCHARLSIPCTECGKPTPTITRTGQQAKHATCVSCTTRLNADSRRIGVRCRVCGKRSHEAKRDYQVCPACMSISAPCPVCGSDMPKYRKAGALRATCSNRCTKILHPTTREQGQRAQRTKWANHSYKSHENDIARRKVEYQDWRQAVFQRDDYTCQECGDRNYPGRGQTLILHPHHIMAFATHPALRYEVSNGVTLCAPCHRKRHEHVFIGRKRRKVRDQLSLPIVEA